MTEESCLIPSQSLNTRKHIRRISMSGGTGNHIVPVLQRDLGGPKPRSHLSLPTLAGRFPSSREPSMMTNESPVRGIDGVPMQTSPRAQLRFSVNVARTDYRLDGEREVHTPSSLRSPIEYVRPPDAVHSPTSEDGRVSYLASPFNATPVC